MASCTTTTYQFDYQKDTEVLYSFVTNDGTQSDDYQSYTCTNLSPITSVTAIENVVGSNIIVEYDTTSSVKNSIYMDLCSGGTTVSEFQSLDLSGNNTISYTVVTAATSTTPGTYNIEIFVSASTGLPTVQSGIFTYTPTYESGTIITTGAFVTWYEPGSTTQTLGTCTIDISGNTYSMNLTPPGGSTCDPVSYIITVADDTITIDYTTPGDIPATPNYYPQIVLSYLGLMATLAGVIDGVSDINKQSFNVGLMCLMPAVFNYPYPYDCGN